MKKLLAILLILTLVCVALVACGATKQEAAQETGASQQQEEVAGNTSASIVGTWTYESGGYTYVFKEDGTGTYCDTMEFTYEVDGNKLSILYTGNTAPFETEFSIDGNKLNIIDSLGNDTIYVKQ